MRSIIIFIASAVIVHAAALEPGEAALDFLGKVRVKSVRLDAGGDTAISPHVTESKRREISRRLIRMAKDLQGGELELGPVNVDGEFAAALVRKTGGYDPADLRVFAVGLVRRDRVWRAAPVPASFDNASVGYSIALRKRLEFLENWMLAEMNEDLERMRGILSARMRQEIGAKLSLKKLQTMTVEEVGKLFLEVCEGKDVPTILGLLGGLSRELPDDWTRRLNVAESVRANNFGKLRAWRLMGAEEVLRVMVHHETGDGDGLFTIACLEPELAESPDVFSRTEFLHLELSKDRDGLWRMDPPSPFFENEPTDGEAGEDDFDQDLLDVFPQELRKIYPAIPASSAEEAYLKFREAMANRNEHSYLSSVVFPDNKTAANIAIRKALSLWWNLNEPAGARYLVPLSFRQDGGEAMAVMQVFSAREPALADLRVLRFVRNQAGWFWQVPEGDDISKQSKNRNLVDWAKMEMIEWNRKWQDTILKDTVRIEGISSAPAPAVDEARELIDAYLGALSANDPAKVLGKLARFGDARDCERMLRNLGFEISAARQSAQTSGIIGVFPGKHWTGVGVKMGEESTAEYMLYPVVTTDKGPKILLEVDLIYARKRGREFLNGVALDRLNDFVDEDVVEALRDIYKTFDAKVKSLEDGR